MDVTWKKYQLGPNQNIKIEPQMLDLQAQHLTFEARIVNKWYSFQTWPTNYIVGFLLLVTHFHSSIQLCLLLFKTHTVSVSNHFICLYIQLFTSYCFLLFHFPFSIILFSLCDMKPSKGWRERTEYTATTSQPTKTLR